MKKNENIYLLKGNSKRLNKARSLILRVDGVTWVSAYPLNADEFCSSKLTNKLARQIKLSKLNDKLLSKKIRTFYILITKSKRFDTLEKFEFFKEKNKKPYKRNTFGSTYGTMPISPKKDNGKLNYGKSRWNEMSKKQLITASLNVRGTKIRIPRKNASKQKWINFLEKFSNKNWEENNG